MAANHEFHACRRFLESLYPCEIRIRYDAEFSVRQSGGSGYHTVSVPYLACITFDKNISILDDLFDTPKWMIAVVRLPKTLDEFNEVKTWWTTLYCQIISDRWRNMSLTEAPSAFPQDIIDYVLDQCRTHYFFFSGGVFT